MVGEQRYSVVVSKDYLKFAAAHFIAFPGFREPLHGHNYQVSVSVEADLGPDGYVLDFGLVKRVAKALCEELDERVLLPERSDCLVVTRTEDAVGVAEAPGQAAYCRETCGGGSSPSWRSRPAVAPRCPIRTRPGRACSASA